MTALYVSNEVTLPVGFQIVSKTERYWDTQKQKEQRRSPTSKNTYYQQLLRACVKNAIPFQYVINDIWYASAENMQFVKHTLKKDFIVPLKSNRKVALSKADKRQGNYLTIETLVLKENTIAEVYLEGVDFPLLLVKQVFVNDDGSIGVLYLVTSDTTLTYERITTLYRTRWHVEDYHKSLKQNASLEKSPTRTVTTQTTHFFASLCAYIKLEMLKIKTHLSHTTMKINIYMEALSSAYAQLRSLQPIRLSKKPLFA